MSKSRTPPGVSPETLVKLLRQNTSLDVVRDFLREHDLPLSGNDEDVRKRLVDACIEHKLGLDALYKHLCDAEEHGAQHVFLYQRTPGDAQRWLHRSAPALIEENKAYRSRLKAPLIVEEPEVETLVDVRFEADGTLICKWAETREHHEPYKTRLKNGYLHKIWKISRHRGINVAVVRPSGICEVRLHSGHGPRGYAEALARVRSRTDAVVPWTEYSELALGNVVQAMWDDRANLAGVLKWTNTQLTDSTGMTCTIAASVGGAHDDVSGNSAGEGGFEGFANNGGYLSGSLLMFTQGNAAPPVPARNLHVLVRGLVNEYSIQAQCAKADHEHILSHILRYCG